MKGELPIMSPSVFSTNTVPLDRRGRCSGDGASEGNGTAVDEGEG